MIRGLGIVFFLMSIALSSLGQEPSVGNRVASSEIRVRIPSYAIIQLAKNFPNKTSVSALANPKAELRNPAQSTIISNQKWILHIEMATPEQQSKPAADTQIIYTTSPK